MKLLPETQLIVPVRGLHFHEAPVPVVSRPRTDQDACDMSSAQVTLSEEWLIVEWDDRTRTIVHSEQVCDVKDSTLLIKRGDFMVKASIVDRSPDRAELVKTLKEAIRKRHEELLLDEENKEPTDENASPSKVEVENRKRNIYLSKKKREPEPKNVLKPSNTENTQHSCTCRKQGKPRQYITPTKEDLFESLIYIPKPKKIILPNGRTVHILPNSTGKYKKIKEGKPNNSQAQNAPNKNRNEVTPINEKIVTPKVRQSQRKTSKICTPETNATKPDTPIQTPKANIYNQNAVIGNEKKQKTEESKSNVDQNNLIEKSSDTKNTSCIPKKEVKPQMKNNNKKPGTKSQTVQAETVNKITKYANKIHEDVKTTNCCTNDKEIKNRPGMINVVMDVEKYLQFRKSMETMHNMYMTSLNLKKNLGKAFQSTIENIEKNKTCFEKESPKATKNINCTNRVVAKKEPVYHTNKAGAKKEPVTRTNEAVLQKTNNKADENVGDVEDEILDDLDQSDFTLISNKVHTINASEDTKKEKEANNLVAIGSGKTLLPKDKFRKIKWNSYTVATRGLLLAAFPRRVLATHSMTGKKSPAFLNKPAKMCLDPKKVADIIIEVMDRFKIKSNLIRSVITTKCADESKMFKMRMKKLENSTLDTNNRNTKKHL